MSPRPRSGNGYPRAYRRKADGLWVAQIELPRDPATGRRRQARTYHRTEALANAALVRALARRGGHRFGNATTPLGAYLRAWLETRREDLKPSTLADYERRVEQAAEAPIGKVRLDRLSRADVAAYADDLRRAGVGAYSRRLTLAVLSSALQRAARLELIDANPVKGVDRPRLTKRRQALWTKEQAAAFLTAARDDPDYPLWELAIVTGARRGELLALRWSDVDRDGCTVRIGQNVQYVSGRGQVFGLPKTEAGARSVAVPAFTLDSLTRQEARVDAARARHGANWRDRDLVFPHTKQGAYAGQPLSGSYVLHRFQKIVAEQGLPRLRFHDLRHLYATLLLVRGVHPKIVQAQLGHSGIAVTLDLYSHAIDEAKQQAADGIAGALGRGPVVSTATARKGTSRTRPDPRKRRRSGRSRTG